MSSIQECLSFQRRLESSLSKECLFLDSSLRWNDKSSRSSSEKAVLEAYTLSNIDTITSNSRYSMAHFPMKSEFIFPIGSGSKDNVLIIFRAIFLKFCQNGFT